MGIMIVFFVGLIVVALGYMRHRERMLLIERGMNPVRSRNGVRTVSLFLGLINVAIGFSLIIASIVMGHKDPLPAGIIVLFIGGAFLVFWRMMDKSDSPVHRHIVAPEENTLIDEEKSMRG